MTLRSDGTFGFPGGFVDPGETLEMAVNREILEEIGTELIGELRIVESDHMYSCENPKNSFVLHFYCKRLPAEKYLEIERNASTAVHFGCETMGLIRVPLRILKNGKGLPNFLRNQFAGNAKEQLLRGLKAQKLVSDEKVDTIHHIFWVLCSIRYLLLIY